MDALLVSFNQMVKDYPPSSAVEALIEEKLKEYNLSPGIGESTLPP